MYKPIGIVLIATMIYGTAVTHAQQRQQVSTEETERVPTLVTPAVAPELIKPVDALTPDEVTRMQKKLSDWPQLGRYREANLKIGDPAPGEERVVFYGDSITDGWGTRYGEFFPGRPYVNRGIGGQTTQQMVARFMQDVVNLHPSAVVILAGINDIAGNTGPEDMTAIQNDFRAMVIMAKAAHIRVVLCSLLPASRIKPRPKADPTQEVIQLNKWLASYAEAEHLVFLNYYPALVDSTGGMRADLSFDGAVHPNKAGYAIMVPLAEAAVRKALKSPRP